MGETEIIIYTILISLIMLIFIAGIVSFLFQYRKRRAEYELEKKMTDEQHAKELLSTQLEIQQQTMQDLGREIHDNVGQKLTLASIYAQQLAFENKYPDVNEKIATIGSIINASLSELRSLSRTLTSDYIQRTELTELIRTECERVNALGKCKVKYQLAQVKIPLDETRKKIVLRIVQEFLQNSLKHAQCTNIAVLVEYTEGKLKIIARDDGAGFDTGEEFSGIGLENMRRRADLIGAQFALTSRLKEGTEINFILATA